MGKFKISEIRYLCLPLNHIYIIIATITSQVKGYVPFVAVLSRHSIVSNATGGEAVRLVAVVHVDAPIFEVQAPAISGTDLRTAPVVAA